MVDQIQPPANIEMERQRLAKLWDAYEIQERDMLQLSEKNENLIKELDEKDRMIQTLREVIESRDREVREMEISFTALGKEHKECPTKIHNMELDMKRNKERFTKLYTLAQELEQELKDTRGQLEERDTWFKENVDVIRNMQRAIDSRDSMVQPLKKGLPSTGDLE